VDEQALAEETFQAAAQIALGVGDLETVTRAWIEIGVERARKVADIDGAHFWLRYAEEALTRLEASGSRHDLRAALDEARGNVLTVEGDAQNAVGAFRRVLQELDQVERESGQDVRLWRARVHQGIGVVLQQMGSEDEALVVYEQVFDATREALGPDHPSLALVQMNIGTVATENGELRRAEAAYRAAVEVLGKAKPRSIHMAMALCNQALALARLGRGPEAIASQTRCEGLVDELMGPGNPFQAYPRMHRARTHMLLNELDTAEPFLAEAMEKGRLAWGPDHPRWATGLAIQSDLALLQERPHEALELGEQAVEAFRRLRTSGRGDPRLLAHAQARLGLAQLALGRVGESIPVLKRALEEEEDPDVRFGLARALWETDSDAAVAHAQEAQRQLREAASPLALAKLRRVEAWLEAHH
jgi:tetratricopeptide (TPR) repeat protein